ncbi:MAG: 1-acyl-sn-glycerol-3-phosphate acyltransferase [Euryarchaeota archaeon]|nr:1-acyl-sn-glycerol-3-phosphate acyltransferase [Euryarchaeota archaeon]
MAKRVDSAAEYDVPDHDTSVFWKVSYATLVPLIRAAWRLRFTGRENIPKEGPAILASNHLSFLDHFLFPPATRRQIYFISKAEHFQSPIKRSLFRKWGVIPLKRGKGDTAAMEVSLELLRTGHLFGIYPEGTRSLDGKLHKGRTGVARLALLSGAPVIPVAMCGTFEAMPKGKSWPRFPKVEVRIGKPLSFGHLADKVEDRATLRRVTDEIMMAIRDLSGQEYVDEYQDNPEYRARQAKEGAAEGANVPKNGSS